MRPPISPRSRPQHQVVSNGLPQTWNHVEEIFLAAADLTAADQSAFLDRACQGNAALRREVEALLGADSRGEALLSAAIGCELNSLLDTDAVSGTRLGAYRVTREIG